MQQRILAFGRRAVRLAWEGKTADRLIDLLFGSIPEADAGHPPHVGLIFQSDDDVGEHFSIRIGPIGREEKGERLERDGTGTAAIALMQQVSFHLADRMTDGVLLHAACVSSNTGSAWALAGSSGTGKSTLSVYLTGHGFSLLSDEMTCIDPVTFACTGLARPIHLKGEWQKILPECNSLPGFAVRDGVIGTLIPAGQYLWKGQAILKGILFPGYRCGEPFRIRRLSPGQAVMGLTRVAMNARNLPANGFPSLLQLARNRPAFQVDYGELPQLDGLLRDILDDSLK